MSRERKYQKTAFLEGNEAVAMAAIYAGVNFYAGYPITPSSEVAAVMSLNLPDIKDGLFVQMEEEAAALGCCLGASIAGRKVLTATSGPGFSIMQELIGYACIAEVPVTIVNVQRGGPSTGLPTQVAQADVMQSRWGTHGDHAGITLAPTTVQETYDFGIRAVNLAEKYRVPVVILMDEVLAHSRENIRLPEKGSVEIINRKRPDPKDKEFKPYSPKHGLVPPMNDYKTKGLRTLTTGLTHNENGYFTTKSEAVSAMLDRLHNKIYDNIDDIIDLEEYQTDDNDVLFVSFGTSARTCGTVVNTLREKGVKAGLLTLKSVWPFPDKRVKEHCDKAKEVFVVEMNMGQVFHEVKRVVTTPEKIKGIFKYDGYIITPTDVLNKANELSNLL